MSSSGEFKSENGRVGFSYGEFPYNCGIGVISGLKFIPKGYSYMQVSEQHLEKSKEAIIKLYIDFQEYIEKGGQTLKRADGTRYNQSAPWVNKSRIITSDAIGGESGMMRPSIFQFCMTMGWDVHKPTYNVNSSRYVTTMEFCRKNILSPSSIKKQETMELIKAIPAPMREYVKTEEKK